MSSFNEANTVEAFLRDQLSGGIPLLHRDLPVKAARSSVLVGITSPPKTYPVNPTPFSSKPTSAKP